ncbi:MAG TPA: chemotaxis protein CheB [Chitinophagaceae bacterium]
MAQGAVTSRLVVIGGSAGSLEILLNIISEMSPGTGTAYVVIIHRRNDSDSLLTKLMRTRTTLAVREVEDKEPLMPGTVYIAPPDYHLLLENERAFSLDTSEKVHYSRPSIDVTFESVANVFGPKAIAVLLSGANADGALGMELIKRAGGTTIAQDPSTAEVSFMPQQAINRNAADHVVEGGKIGHAITELLSH